MPARLIPRLRLRVKRVLGFVLFSAALLPLSHLAAEEPTPAQVEFFETKIRPVLVEHCYSCHAVGAKHVRGGLLLDTRTAIRRGGESGPAVVPNKPDESLLLSALRHESFEMPPDRKLPDSVITDFHKWIAMGAPDPREGEARVLPVAVDVQAGRDFWCFQPIARPEVPPVNDTEWPATNVDRFVLNRLESVGLAPVPDADRRTLLRRAYYDLIGLPPKPQQIDAFLQNESPDAFEQVIDELLRTPRFGERWGRHWLDVVRFAESSGGGRTLLFPDAWRYRDYAIDAFNTDLRYDEFVKQQIAGDLLIASDWRQRRRYLTATAFLLLGPTNFELQDKETLEMDIVDEQLDTMGKAFLGMTLGCARCHDHKFDPIPTRDYYAMAGILKSTKSVIHSNVSKWNEVTLPMSPKEETAIRESEAAIASLQSELKSLQARIKRMGGPPAGGTKSIAPDSLPGIVVDDTQAERRGDWTRSQSVAGYVGESYLYANHPTARVTFSPNLPRRGKYELQVAYTPSSNRSPKVPIRIGHAEGESVVYVDQTKAGSVSRSIESLGLYDFDPDQGPFVTISPKDAASGVVIADAVIFVSSDSVTNDARQKQLQEQRALNQKLASEVEALEDRIDQLRSVAPRRDLAMAVTDQEEVGNVPVSIRGIVHNPGSIVPRGVLQVASPGEMPHIREDQSGRLQLANWIANSHNPLTARVMVNRVWYWLYGSGLVRTVDNFGATGDSPSHPELLDFLATEFMHDGWSVKKLIRRLMLSRTYQLSSLPDSKNASVDPDNRLLGRMNRRRLDAECIRDTMLLVGGNLDLTLGGPNIAAGTKSEYGYEFKSTRRSVYVPVFRNAVPQIFSVFDFADPNTQTGSRASSTTAPQALLLMNHPLVVQQSEAAAQRLLSRDEMSSLQRIHYVYQQVLGRLPNEHEYELAAHFVGDSSQAERWARLYQALFQTLDFRYLQ